MAEPKKMVLKKGKEDKLIGKKDQPKTAGRLDNVTKFLRGVKSELKKVHWPNRKQIMAYTGVTLVTVLIIAGLIWIVDSILSAIVSRVL